jgi:hypothetical protein
MTGSDDSLLTSCGLRLGRLTRSHCRGVLLWHPLPLSARSERQTTSRRSGFRKSNKRDRRTLPPSRRWPLSDFPPASRASPDGGILSTNLDGGIIRSFFGGHFGVRPGISESSCSEPSLFFFNHAVDYCYLSRDLFQLQQNGRVRSNLRLCSNVCPSCSQVLVAF